MDRQTELLLELLSELKNRNVRLVTYIYSEKPRLNGDKKYKIRIVRVIAFLGKDVMGDMGFERKT